MKELLLAFAGSFCAGLVFNTWRGRLFWSGLSGAAGWAVYMWFHASGYSSVLSIFAGAIAVGFYSETAARIFKSPSTLYSIPGIFPLVPGIAAYEFIQNIVENRLQDAGSKGIEALAGAGAIACGILLVTALFRFVTRLGRK